MSVTLAGHVRGLVRSAEVEARADQSNLVEAEHLLLALAGDQGGTARQVLNDAGLDHEAIRAALYAEFEQSLAAGGVSLTAGGLPRSSADPKHKARIASSTKWALHRAVAAAKDRDDSKLEPLHLLIGILRADVGTVPRSLAVASVDRTELIARAERALVGN
jgi:ATP-dependent Clp protease ATP-binding subunit ClpA